MPIVSVRPDPEKHLCSGAIGALSAVGVVVLAQKCSSLTHETTQVLGGLTNFATRTFAALLGGGLTSWIAKKKCNFWDVH